MIGVDRELKIELWNDFVAQITGYPREEALGLSLIDVFVADSHRTQIRRIFERCI